MNFKDDGGDADRVSALIQQQRWPGIRRHAFIECDTHVCLLELVFVLRSTVNWFFLNCNGQSFFSRSRCTLLLCCHTDEPQMPDLSLFQPDIPGNTGTLLRLGACMGIKVHIIEPAGFRLDEKAFRRAGMDYLEQAAMQRHMSWQNFQDWRISENRRLILLTTKSTTPYTDFEFHERDLLLLGRESSGAPQQVHDAADERLTIPMFGQGRSLNMSLSGAMVLGEALRQTR